MRFQRVSFRCFGPFREQTLDLAAAGGLHVIYGPNEAGKSSALRGLRAFLFGFPAQSGDDFLFKYNQFRVHAVLEDAVGRTLECIRRKGNKDTLRSADDKGPIADRQLTDFLGGLDEMQFEQLFGLDSSRLVEGGQAIADGQGELGEALFAAGAGMRGFRTLSQALESRQQALYKPGGKNQPIAETLRKYHELVGEVRSRVLPAETYAAAEAGAQAALAGVAKLGTKRREVRCRLDELKRYKAALPTIDLLHAAQLRLQPVADAPLLSSEFDANLEGARKKLIIARSQLTDQENRRLELTRHLERDQPSAVILAEESELDALNKLVGADKKLAEEAVRAATFSVDEKGKARDIYRELTGATDWEQMDGLKPRLDERQRINELANEHAAVVEHVERADEAVHKAKELLGDACKALDEAPAPVDSSAWQTAVDQIVALGPLEDEQRKRITANQAEEGNLAAEFSSLNPPILGGWPEAPGRPVLLAETLEHFRGEFDAARRADVDVAGAIEQNERDIAELQNLLIDNAGAEPIPTVDELAASRRDRDGGLHCIRRRLDGHRDELVEGDFIRRHAPNRPLMDAAEIAVRQCDTLADRLRHEADRVARSVTLNEKRRRLQEHRQKLDAQARSADDARAALQQGWQSAWLASGVSPADPLIMQSWLNKWTKLCERVARWRTDHQVCQADQERIDSLREQLANACPAAQAAMTLNDGLTGAKRAIAQATFARATAEKYGEEVTRRQAALTKAEQDAEQAGIRRDKWIGQWSDAVAVLRLKETTASVKTAQDYLSRIERMQQHLRDMRIKDARVREIERDRGLLIDRVNGVRKREDALTKNASGVPLRDFIEAAQRHRDGLDQQIDDLARRAEELDTEISTAETMSNEANRVLAEYNQASDAAAKARQEVALLAHRLEEYFVQYAAIHLARTALEKAKERYRARYQDTLLDKAGNYFRMLTEGAYVAIEIDNDDGVDVLKALRAGASRPDARVPVSGLSDGTRDQLFFALRLAGIERHLKDRGPVPLIVDDVLVNFDDNRTDATLRCLAELAKKTQVLLFTHHRHVVKSAQAVSPSTTVQQLGSCP